jgi:hypothetical protein
VFDFLHEQVAVEGSIPYILERYARRMEWFDRDGLDPRVMEGTRKTEEVYDTDLRRFRFSEGINMPFSQARSGSGLSDVLAGLDTEEMIRVRSSGPSARPWHRRATWSYRTQRAESSAGPQRAGWWSATGRTWHPWTRPGPAAGARHLTAVAPRPDPDHLARVLDTVNDQRRQPREHDPRKPSPSIMANCDTRSHPATTGTVTEPLLDSPARPGRLPGYAARSMVYTAELAVLSVHAPDPGPQLRVVWGVAETLVPVLNGVFGVFGSRFEYRLPPGPL